LIKYIKSVLWRVAKCLSYIEEARCLKVKGGFSYTKPRFPLNGSYTKLCIEVFILRYIVQGCW